MTEATDVIRTIILGIALAIAIPLAALTIYYELTTPPQERQYR